LVDRHVLVLESTPTMVVPRAVPQGDRPRCQGALLWRGWVAPEALPAIASRGHAAGIGDGVEAVVLSQSA
jgi:hypothetical protein